ncbi:trigger factor [Ectothiorhodospiraceae bacterium WFHF3C12]|nr:trigger factor [Ectothiorhodospiraceae bacterium WFHF3C12]
MEVSVETTQGLERRMTVQVPAERVDNEVENRLQSMKGRVRMDGFRPGKVPLKVVRQRYGAQVRQEVLGEVIQATYSEALNEKDLRPAGQPSVEPTQMEPGQDLEYTATFEVMPEVAVKDLDKVSIKRPDVEVSDDDVEEVLQRLQKQHAEYKAVKRKARKEDRVTIDFHGQVDGEDFEGNTGEDVPVTLGSGGMPEEFEKSLEGIKAGEETTIEYTFPEQFPDEKIAGKTASFQVTAKAVEGPDLPELDDGFAEQLGFKDEGIDGLRQKIRENLERERDQAVRQNVKQQAMDGLLEHNDVEIPQSLLDGEIDHLRNQAKERMRQYGAGDAEPDLPASAFEDEARRRVKLGLLVNEVIRANEIQVDEDRLRETLEGIASGYERPQEVIQYYTQNRQLMEGLEISVLEEQVAEHIAQQAKVEDAKMSLDELMKQQQSSQ